MKVPYAGITRIRSEGLISARNIGHPLTCSLQVGCKGSDFFCKRQSLSRIFGGDKLYSGYLKKPAPKIGAGFLKFEGL